MALGQGLWGNHLGSLSSICFFGFVKDGSQIPTVLLFDYNYFSTVHLHGLWENFDIVAFGKLDIITVRRVWKYAIGLDSFHFA